MTRGLLPGLTALESEREDTTCGSATSMTASGAMKRGKGEAQRRAKSSRSRYRREVTVSSEEEIYSFLPPPLESKKRRRLITIKDKGIEVRARKMEKESTEDLNLVTSPR